MTAKGFIFALAALAAAPQALAQQQPQQQPQPQPQPQQQQASECQARLMVLADQARQEGFWLQGWRGDVGGMRAGTTYHRPGLAEPAPAYGFAGAPRALTEPGTPFYVVVGPREELRVMFGAAEVFAQRGNEQACAMIAAELEQAFQEHVAMVREQGIDPARAAAWRQEQLLGAQPVEQVAATFRTEDLFGADVRNLQDEYLGSIDDVVMDAATGRIGYVLVSRGGFLGLGREQFAVRWQDLHVSPIAQTFVLDVPQAVAEAAPTMQPESFGDPAAFAQQRQQVDQYWAGHLRTD